MNIDYLELEDVIDLHDWALELYGGLQGLEPGKLEAKLALPRSGFSSVERYPTIEAKAACYLYELVRGHCFADGNKRTAYLSAFTFLDINGYDLIVEDEEVFRFVSKIADDKTRPDFDEVVLWIARHIYKKEE
jgi:death-on-curing protein